MRNSLASGRSEDSFMIGTMWWWCWLANGNGDISLADIFDGWLLIYCRVTIVRLRLGCHFTIKLERIFRSSFRLNVSCPL